MSFRVFLEDIYTEKVQMWCIDPFCGGVLTYLPTGYFSASGRGLPGRCDEGHEERFR